jgi:hypothetical protein
MAGKGLPRWGPARLAAHSPAHSARHTHSKSTPCFNTHTHALHARTYPHPHKQAVELVDLLRGDCAAANQPDLFNDFLERVERR